MAFVYSCCFWFSLRLAGIMIGSFSVLQGLLIIISSVVACQKREEVQKLLTYMISNLDLSSMKGLIINFNEDPDKIFTVTIANAVIYCCISLTYVYGAYKCKISLMIGYLFVELLRLVLISAATIMCLLILKLNTMDIGQLIGASVASGFSLLGMFYLWVCCLNLPILIKEIEDDENRQAVTALENLLRAQARRLNRLDLDDLIPIDNEANNAGISMLPRYNAIKRSDLSYISNQGPIFDWINHRRLPYYGPRN